MLLRRFDHLFRFSERDRHGFLHDDVLAVLGGHDRVRRVEPVRRGNPNRFDIGIRAKLFNAVVGLCAVPVLKSVQNPPVYVRRRHELDVGHRFHLRQDLRRADADADNAEPKPAANGLIRVYPFCHRQSPFECEPQPSRFMAPFVKPGLRSFGVQSSEFRVNSKYQSEIPFSY